MPVLLDTHLLVAAMLQDPANTPVFRGASQRSHARSVR